MSLASLPSARPSRGPARSASGVEVLLDKTGDVVEGGGVVARDLDDVAARRAQGHQEQGGARVDTVDGDSDTESTRCLGDERSGSRVISMC